MISYLYYWNEQLDAQGRSLGFERGYEDGDLMKLIYKGKLAVSENITTKDLEICEYLYEMFNINPPADYRGPSMSMGSVVVFNGKAYACDRFGFKPIEIDMAPEWNTGTIGQLKQV